MVAQPKKELPRRVKNDTEEKSCDKTVIRDK